MSEMRKLIDDEIARWELFYDYDLTAPKQIADIAIGALRGLGNRLADTSPAGQERDDLERIAEMADVSPAHCGDPEVLKVLHGIRDELRALARLRSGSEPGKGVKWVEHGAANLNPERWEGYKGVSGEGAPEPDRKGDWCDCGCGAWRAPRAFDRLPPERDAEAENLAAMKKNWADREAEIRADERRKVLDEMRDEIGAPTKAAFLTIDKIHAILARLSPTDEQESPNRSDEP